MKLLLLCLILSAGELFAATYYVDATGGSDAANGTSTGTAWQTIAKVNSSSFGAGDSILFKRGETWAEKLIPPNSGAIGNPITHAAYGSGALPIIQAALTGRPEAVSLGTGITYNTISYLHCKGGDTGSNSALIESQSITNLVEYCTIDALGLSDSCVGGSSTVRNCSILNARDDGYTLHTTDSGLVENCYFYGNRSAINNSGTNMTMTVNDCIFEHSGDGAAGFGDIGDLSFTTSTFNRCWFKGRRDSDSYSFFSGADASKTTTFNYCVFNASAASNATQPSMNCNAPVVFNNCVFYGHPTETRGAMSVTGTVTATNCIVYRYTRWGNISGAGALNATNCILYNVPANANSAQTTNTNGLTSDPLLAAPTTGDVHLLTGSPAIGTGTNLGLTLDIYGFTVLNPPSRGAAEFTKNITVNGTLTVGTLVLP